MCGTYNFLATTIQQDTQIITIFKLSTFSRSLHKVVVNAMEIVGLCVVSLCLDYTTDYVLAARVQYY